MRLMDISLSGALLAAEVPLPAGAPAQLRSGLGAGALSCGRAGQANRDAPGRRAAEGARRDVYRRWTNAAVAVSRISCGKRASSAAGTGYGSRVVAGIGRSAFKEAHMRHEGTEQLIGTSARHRGAVAGDRPHRAIRRQGAHHRRERRRQGARRARDPPAQPAGAARRWSP